MLTLEQFRESREFHLIGCEEAGLEGSGYTYANRSCYIDLVDRKYSLTIHNSCWSAGNTLDYYEEILYNEYYVDEVGPEDDRIGKIGREL